MAFMTIWHVVHTIAAAFLIGPEFARNPEYMRQIEYYCMEVPGFVHLYFWIPSPLRKAFWYLSPWGFKVRKCIVKLKGFIIPELRKRIQEYRETGSTGYEFTLVGAMLSLKMEKGLLTRKYDPSNAAEEERQIEIFAEEVIFTAFDSAGPVAVLIVQLLFETSNSKEHVAPLRNEIAAANAAHGEWSDQALNSMPRLESFTRETLRLDGPTLCKCTVAQNTVSTN